jgi:Dit-like phage tail protein
MPEPSLDTPQVTIIHSIETLTFDAVLTESHESQLQVTSNPVETGVMISDHCFMQPLKVTISAAVSDLKLPSGSPDYDDASSGRARRAFELLQTLQANTAKGDVDPFSVSTGLRLYEKMVCVGITARQDADTASLLSFDADLQEIITVDTKTVTYKEPKLKPAPKKPAQQATPAVDKGKQQPKPPPASLSTGGVDALPSWAVPEFFKKPAAPVAAPK